MSSGAEEHVLYQIANAPMREYPYAHFYVENVFPDDFYAALRANWPDPSALVSIADTGRVPKGAYPERFVLAFKPDGIDKLTEERRTFWTEFAGWFLADRFLTAMIDKFERYVRQRFGDEFHHRYSFDVDSLIVRDLTNYSIGPHTDAPHRLLSMLFYCPADDSRKHLGTSIYAPIDPDFRCKGGPHYPHRLFQKVRTMEYKRNSLFAFIKNDRSFHGVDPISEEHIERDVLLYDVRVMESEHEPSAQATGIGLKMLKRLFGDKQG